MRYLLFLLLSILCSCEELIEVLRFDGPCTILMKDGSTIITQESIEILESTGAITYRDDEGLLWSVAVDEYESYTCGN